MATATKKSKLALPPTPQQVDEKAMKAMIEKGGAVASTTKKATTPEEDKLRSFTIKIYESELAAIRSIQERMGPRDKISIHDFIVSAVKDRIKKTNIHN